NEDITIGLSNLDWFDGHMAGPFKAVVRNAEARGNIVRFSRPHPKVELTLRRNGLLPGGILEKRLSAIPLKQFSLEESILFSQYAKEHLARAEMPRMSDALMNKFFEGIDELFSNSALHSKSSQGVFVAGQFYRTQQKLDFVIADVGRGI